MGLARPSAPGQPWLDSEQKNLFPGTRRDVSFVWESDTSTGRVSAECSETKGSSCLPLWRQLAPCAEMFPIIACALGSGPLCCPGSSAAVDKSSALRLPWHPPTPAGPVLQAWLAFKCVHWCVGRAKGQQSRLGGQEAGGGTAQTHVLPPRPPQGFGPSRQGPPPRQPSPGHQNFPPHPALGPRSPASLLLAPGYRPCPSGLEGLPGRPGLSRDPRGPRGQGRAPMQVLLIEPIRDWMRGKTALGVGRPRPGAGGAAVLSACERACVGQGQPTRGWGQCSWWAGPRGPGWHPVASGSAV